MSGSTSNDNNPNKKESKPLNEQGKKKELKRNEDLRFVYDVSRKVFSIYTLLNGFGGLESLTDIQDWIQRWLDKKDWINK